ncbi:MAG: cytochrome c class [Thermoleophilia bacterium]|nr:cytochrome c class [Thermoleophilia bacterium]
MRRRGDRDRDTRDCRGYDRDHRDDHDGNDPDRDDRNTETTETGPAVEGDPAAGKEIFLGASSCGGCHTLADAGTTGAVGPNFDETKPSYEFALDRVTNGQGGMPSFSATLTEQQLADVAAYVSSAAGS